MLPEQSQACLRNLFFLEIAFSCASARCESANAFRAIVAQLESTRKFKPPTYRTYPPLQTGLFVSVLVSYVQLSPVITSPVAGTLCGTNGDGWPYVYYLNRLIFPLCVRRRLLLNRATVCLDIRVVNSILQIRLLRARQRLDRPLCHIRGPLPQFAQCKCLICWNYRIIFGLAVRTTEMLPYLFHLTLPSEAPIHHHILTNRTHYFT